MVWLDRMIFISLCCLVFVLPATIAGVGIFATLAAVLVVVKRMLLVFLKKDGACLVPRQVLISSLAFLAFCALSIFLSEDSGLSIKAFVGKTLQGILLMFAAIETVRTRRRFAWLLGTFVASTAILCIDGLWQFWQGQDFFSARTLIEGRVCAAMRHPNDLGTYLILAGTVVFAFLSWACGCKATGHLGGRRSVRIGFVALFLLICVVLGLTYSRGSWLGALVGIGIFIALHRKYIWIAAGTAVLFAIVFLPAMASTRNVSFVSDNVSVDAQVRNGKPDFSEFTGQDRLNMWKDALQIIADHPWTGTGLNTYSVMIKKYTPHRQMYAHNSYLQMAAELGLIGLGIFLWLLWSVGFYARRVFGRYRSSDGLVLLLTGLFAGWLGFLLQSGLDTTFYSVQLSRLLWLVMGLLVAGAALLEKEAGLSRNS